MLKWVKIFTFAYGQGQGGGVGIFSLLNTTLWGPNGWDTFQVFLKIRSTQEDFSRLFLMHGQIKLTWLF